ncbi:MAG: hypothetical protein QM610_06695 [Chitinophagaceae bacterium]
MKNFLLFVLVSLINVSYGQMKPTKQETIDWLISKFKVYKRASDFYNIPGVSDVSITCEFYKQENNAILVQSTYGRGFGNGNDRIDSYVLNLNNICSISLVNHSHNVIRIHLKNPINVSSTSLRNGGGTEVTQKSIVSVSVGFDNVQEENIEERTARALATLADYNCPPVKEPF